MKTKSNCKTIWVNILPSLHAKMKKLPYGSCQKIASIAIKAALASPDLKTILSNPKAKVALRIVE